MSEVKMFAKLIKLTKIDKLFPVRNSPKFIIGFQFFSKL